MQGAEFDKTEKWSIINLTTAKERDTICNRRFSFFLGGFRGDERDED